MSSPAQSDLVLVERSNTVYKCEMDDFRAGAIASKGMVLAISRRWTSSYTGTGGQIYGVPSGTTWYQEGSTNIPVTTTSLSSITNQNYARRPAIQLYSDNLDGQDYSGWTDWITSYMYWGEYDHYSWINGGSGSGYNSNLTLCNYSAREIQGANRAPRANFTRIRIYVGAGYQYAANGHHFEIALKFVNDNGTQDFVNTQYSGTTGGTFYSFYNDADGLDQLTTSGYKDYTKNTSNLFQWS